LWVEPREVPADHPLAMVSREENAVLVRGDDVGELLFRGRGAGARPTATAVLADLCDVMRGAGEEAALRPAPALVAC
jgi:homoserine dehydrogenase